MSSEPEPGNAIIYDGPHIRVVAHRGSSRFALVTFNGRGFNAKGDAMWAGPIAERLDLNAVGFVTKGPNWFPLADLAVAVVAARTHLAPFPERIGYGYSQGAFAAIKASRPLGLTATIAVSPQWSIDPADIVDDRYNRFFAPDLNARMAIAAGDAPDRLIALTDMGHALDRQHMAAIRQAIGDFTLVNVPSSSHDTIKVLRGTSGFTAILDAVRSGASIVPVVARLRRSSNVRNEVIIKRLLKREKIDRALRTMLAVTLDPEAKTKTLLKFIRRGAAEQVVRVARQHTLDRPRDSYAMAVLAIACAAAGRPKLADQAADAALRLGRSARVVRLAAGAKRRGARIGLAIGEDEDDEDEA